jgi:threonine dehydrogenase-like Zn-dependent dehydrogenase
MPELAQPPAPVLATCPQCGKGFPLVCKDEERDTPGATVEVWSLYSGPYAVYVTCPHCGGRTNIL